MKMYSNKEKLMLNHKKQSYFVQPFIQQINIVHKKY